MGEAHLFIISGPSGAGKGTLVKELLRRVPDLWVSVSATTRVPRPGEKDGIDYFFLTPSEFEVRARHGEFLEHAEVHGNRYGTLRAPVERRLAHDVDVMLEIDPQGAAQVRKVMDRSRLIFVKAPTTEDLEKRIRYRGAESEEQLRTRLKTAERELAVEGMYDFVVINDDVSRATDELVAYIRSLSEDATGTAGAPSAL
ncbi:MAG: guanylate kinase [Coriobacteriia bacterium]|jgi:guanylate kinase|nr:guanylate kinase [Coriobacteriia bacterium]